MSSKDLDSCQTCGDDGEIKCSCHVDFCCEHWAKHRKSNPSHTRAPPSQAKARMNWIMANTDITSPRGSKPPLLQKEEGAKWFGFVTNTVQSSAPAIIETPRFSNLIEDSVHIPTNSPKRQFPSIISFVGKAGAGKSTLGMLISMLIHLV